jgi:hypothetical protein
MSEIDKMLSQVNDLVNSTNVKEEIVKEEIKKDFATKEQRDAFNEIISQFTGTKRLDDYSNSVFYMVGENVFIERNLKFGNFDIRYSNFWEVFKSKFGLSYQEISDLLRGLLEEHFKCKVNTTWQIFWLKEIMLDEHFKCKVNITTDDK